MGQETKKVLRLDPWLQFCIARTLSRYLVRANLYVIEQIVGSHEYRDKRCEVCLNVQATS